MSERRKTILEFDDDLDVTKSLPEVIEWLNGIAAEAPCPPEEIHVRLYLFFDGYDGYGRGELEITRPMTDDEIAAQDAAWAASSAARAERIKQQEYREFERLKAKFQPKETGDE